MQTYPTGAPLNNPYTPTTADLSSPGGAATYQPKLFAMDGRIGRLRYLAYLMGVSILLGFGAILVVLLMSQVLGVEEVGSTAIMVLAYIPILVLSFVIVIRRLNDMNKSGWLSLLNLIPIVNIGMALWLLFGSGDEGANQYGPPPCKNTTGVIVACIAPLVFAVVVGVMAGSFVAMMQGKLLPKSTDRSDTAPAAEQVAQ